MRLYEAALKLMDIVYCWYYNTTIIKWISVDKDSSWKNGR